MTVLQYVLKRDTQQNIVQTIFGHISLRIPLLLAAASTNTERRGFQPIIDPTPQILTTQPHLDHFIYFTSLKTAYNAVINEGNPRLS